VSRIVELKIVCKGLWDLSVRGRVVLGAVLLDEPAIRGMLVAEAISARSAREGCSEMWARFLEILEEG
jgi:hypothetical protein